MLGYIVITALAVAHVRYILSGRIAASTCTWVALTVAVALTVPAPRPIIGAVAVYTGLPVFLMLVWTESKNRFE